MICSLYHKLQACLQSRSMSLYCGWSEQELEPDETTSHHLILKEQIFHIVVRFIAGSWNVTKQLWHKYRCHIAIWTLTDLCL